MKMEIRKVIVIQAMSTFLILSSSCSATQETNYEGGSSPSPAELELDANFIGAACKRTYKKEFCYESLSPYAYDIDRNQRSLCSRASWLAIQGLSNVSQAISHLKEQQPIELLPDPMPLRIDGCSSSFRETKQMIDQAWEEGAEDHQYYGVINLYDIAIGYTKQCAFSEPIAEEVKAANDVAVMLISNLRDLCS